MLKIETVEQAEELKGIIKGLRGMSQFKRFEELISAQANNFRESLVTDMVRSSVATMDDLVGLARVHSFYTGAIQALNAINSSELIKKLDIYIEAQSKIVKPNKKIVTPK